MSELEYAWAAGFLEGEGSIGIYEARDRGKNASWMDPHIEAYNTELPLLQHLQKILGGKIYLKAKAGSNYGSHHRYKDYYRWGVHRREALRVAKLILPYLNGVKKKKAEEIIEYYRNRPIYQARDQFGRFARST